MVLNTINISVFMHTYKSLKQSVHFLTWPLTSIITLWSLITLVVVVRTRCRDKLPPLQGMRKACGGGGGGERERERRGGCGVFWALGMYSLCPMLIQTPKQLPPPPFSEPPPPPREMNVHGTSPDLFICLLVYLHVCWRLLFQGLSRKW